MPRSITVSGVLAALLLFAVAVVAEVPHIISYQGRLTDSGGEPVTDGLYLIKFSLYDAATSGTTLWDSQYRSIQVTDGIFSYLMGDTVAIPDAVFTSYTNVWLGIKVGSDPELSPRTRMGSAPYAYRTWRSDYATHADNGVPVGTVIDWWRPNESFPVPSSYQICDGSTVDDPESPMNGFALPDLRNQFVVGANTLVDIGTAGGLATHSHDHDHAAVDHSHTIDPPTTSSSTTNADHTHSVNPPSTVSTSDSHNHHWSFLTTAEDWKSYGSDGTSTILMFDHPVGGYGVAGSNNTFPIAVADPDGNITSQQNFYTGSHSHTHAIDITAFNSGSASSPSHYHTTDIGSFSSGNQQVDLPNTTSTTASSIPPNVALMKIMRIK